MANTSSAKKAIRVSERRLRENKPVRTGARTAVKKARLAIADRTSAEGAGSAVVAAISALDKAASKHVIHRRAAARRKSRLMKAYNTSSAVSSTGA